MKNRCQSLFQSQTREIHLAQPGCVFFLNLLVISLHNSVFANEVVVSGAQSHSCLGGNIAHGGGIKTALAKKLKSRVQNFSLCVLTPQRYRFRLEHVQIMEQEDFAVKKKMNTFNNRVSVFIVTIYKKYLLNPPQAYFTAAYRYV